MNKIKGIIFDLDGTLADSLPMWRQIACSVLDRYGIAADNEAVERFLSDTALDAANYIIKRFSVKASAKLLEEEISRETENGYNYVSLKPHISKLIKYFHKSGVKMAVATASRRRDAECLLRRAGILKYMEHIVVCDEIGYGKEYPYVYYEAERLIKVKRSGIAVFEDSYSAIRTAKKAGYTVFAVNDDCSLYEEKKREEADFYIGDYREVYDIFKSQCGTEEL